MYKKQHGHTWDSGKMSPTYVSWSSMKQRCLNKRHVAYKKYGMVGITICPKWRESFVEFLADMGERPNGKTLDRIDNEKGYSKENCRWATPKEQANNKKNNFITFNNKKQHINEICKKYGITKYYLHQRLYAGWSLSDIFSLKIERNRPKCTNFIGCMPNVRKRDQMKWLKEKGCTLSDIGKYFGVSKQCVHQKLK
jgi:hypothetical protein